MEQETRCGKCGIPIGVETTICPSCHIPINHNKPRKKRFGRLSLARFYSGARKAERPEGRDIPLEVDLKAAPDIESGDTSATTVTDVGGYASEPESDSAGDEDNTFDNGTLQEEKSVGSTPSESEVEVDETSEDFDEVDPDEDEKISQLENILTGMATPDAEGEGMDLESERIQDRMPAVPIRANAMNMGSDYPKVQTFVEGFDELLDGGIPDGNIILITGEAGSMKSSLAYYILYSNILSLGARCFYVTLEQTLDSLLRHVNSMGMDPQLTQDNLRMFDLGYIRKHIPKSKKDWFEMFMENVDNVKETRGFDILVIDSLEALEVLANFENRRTDLFRLFEWLRDMDATSFIITERSDCPFGQHLAHAHNEEGFLADGIISLALHPTSAIDVQRRIRCVKMRGAKHETGYLSLMWDEGKFKVTKAIGR